MPAAPGESRLAPAMSMRPLPTAFAGRVCTSARVVAAQHRVAVLCRAARGQQLAAVLDSWRAHTQLKAADTLRVRRLQQHCMRRALQAWHQQVLALQECMVWALRWHHRGVQQRCYGAWRQQLLRLQQLVQMHRSQRQAVVLQQMMQVGHTMQADATEKEAHCCYLCRSVGHCQGRCHCLDTATKTRPFLIVCHCRAGDVPCSSCK